MSQPTYIDTRHSAFDDRIHKEAGKRRVIPFIGYADGARAAALGIEAVIGLLRHDAITRDEDDVPVLSPYDIDGLLGLVQFAAIALRNDADHLRTWADKHFVQEDQQ